MKQIKLSITETYVSHWGWWQGIREILQNAVDTKDYDVDFGLDNIRIVSRGGKIPVSALLLGKTTKADDESTIGKFGEGMKLGFLVLKRLGAGVVVNNAGDLWSPEMVFDDLFNENVLAVNIEEGSLIASPATVEIGINNIPPEVVEEIKSKFAPTQNRKVVIESRKGKAYEKDGDHQNCRLFVSGIFVTEIEGKFKFDYDFCPNTFILDRDRDTANNWEVKYHAAELIRDSDDVELLAELATENYADLAEFRGSFERRYGSHRHRGYSEGYEENNLNDRAVQVFQEKNGYEAFPINKEWDSVKKRLVTHKAVKHGYVPIEVNNATFTMIKHGYEVDEEVEAWMEFKPLEFLEKFLEKHRRKMYNKTIRELEQAIEMLKVAKG